MLRSALNICTRIWIACVLLALVMRAAASDMPALAAIQGFFVPTQTCSSTPCFMNIIPGETSLNAIHAQLRQHTQVASYTIAERQSQNVRVDWLWNGTQPAFMQRPGSVRLREDFAAYIVLEPDLLLGEVLIALGEPAYFSATDYTARAHYPRYGLAVRFLVDCRSLYHSVPQIIFDVQPPSNDRAAALHDIRRMVCIK